MGPTVVAAWIAAGVSVLTLISTVIVQIIGFRSTRADTERQIKATREDTADTLAQQRDQLTRTLDAQSRQLEQTLGEQRTRTWNERFTTAAEQLGSDKPAIRLAGVYAIAGLADDWKENRQTCVDVLCAYLQLPYEPDPGSDAPEPQRLAFRASQKVRHTVIRVITAHLREESAVSWQGLDFDFTGAVFDGGDFSRAQFTRGTVDFTDTHFPSGHVDFRSAEFSGATVTFSFAEFSGGKVNFEKARVSGGTVDFSYARFSDGWIRLRQSPVFRRCGRLRMRSFLPAPRSGLSIARIPAARSTSARSMTGQSRPQSTGPAHRPQR